jgi:hypothetical protein
LPEQRCGLAVGSGTGARISRPLRWDVSDHGLRRDLFSFSIWPYE